ncbi:MAG: hypothetical protein IKS99_00795 [Firmicutes bacterium]|nr:hypothetical protein [Bacillota bacterium]
MKQNLHTHTLYCDGQNTIPEIIRAALIKDFGVLGFSGHSFTYYDKSYCMAEEGTDEYIDEVLAAKRLFARDPEAAARHYGADASLQASKEGLRVFLGLEQDLYSDKPALRREHGLLNPGYPGGVYDYLIGSVHAFRLTWAELQWMGTVIRPLREPDLNGVVFSDDGAYIYVDYGLDTLNWALENVFGGDPLALAAAYFEDEGRIVCDTDCDIVGHFDLLLKFNERERIFDEDSPRYKAVRDRALERIFSDFRAWGRRPLFEVNTGAMAKGYRTEPYPSKDSLSLIRDMGGSLIINSDCHQADKLDYAFDEAVKYVTEAGFRPSSIEIPGRGELRIYE